MEVGNRYEIVINGSPAWAEVIDPVEWGISRPTAGSWMEAILVVEGGGIFPPRTIAHINEVLAASYNVLRVPAIGVHSVDGRYFVYVLEDGLRRMRTVEIGLVTHNFVEIISGLAEGDVVVI
jgi:hypothetical protein